MAWFKVDDKLHDHRKARRVRKSDTHKARDVAPFGIWTLAGSWCGGNKTGGFIPLEVLEEWDDDAEVLAERLVDAGLWWHDVVNGEDGYRFHDWADQNPIEGEDPGDYGRRGNHIRWHERRDVVDPDCDLCNPADRPDIGGDNRGESGVESSRPDPTRPDPTPSRAASSTDREFTEWWTAYPRKVAKGQAAKAYKAARKKVEADLLLSALIQQTPRITARGEEFTPYPATWLNGERWADEQPAPVKPRLLPNAQDIELPPDGLTPAEYAAWDAAQREKQRV